MCGLFFAVTIADCIINNAWRRYRLLWIIMGIIGGYLIYSFTYCRFNVTKSILMDAFIEIKPFAAFAIILGSNLRLESMPHKAIKILATIIATFMSFVIVSGYRFQNLISGHPSSAGMTIFLATMIYLAVSIDTTGKWSRLNLILATIWLCCGLACGRSKYYAEFILAIFFIFFYRPMMLKSVKTSHVIIVSIFVICFIAATWHKIQYYFITGASDTFDPNVMASFARPALYATGLLILIDYFPFGCGLASFATYPSSAPYSSLYYEYNLDKIWGLSPSYPNFICDAYYPSLAQFGIVGVILFVWFWRYAYRFLLRFLHTDATKYRNYFVIGTLIICFVLIECTSHTGFSTARGFMAMIILGLVARKSLDIKDISISSDDNINRSTQIENKQIKRITI